MKIKPTELYNNFSNDFIAHDQVKTRLLEETQAKAEGQTQ